METVSNPISTWSDPLAACPVHSIAKRAAVAALALIAAGPAVSQGIGLPSEDTVAARMEVFNSSVPGSVYALQPWLNAQEVTVARRHDLPADLAQSACEFVVRARNRHAERAADVLSPRKRGQASVAGVAGDDGGEPAIRLEDDTGDVILCTPWDGELADAEATGLPYAPLCDWSMFLRNPVRGNRTTREAVSDFLRDNIVFGDSLVNLIKGAFYEDAFMVSSEELETEEQVSGVELLGSALLSRTPVMRPAMGFDLIGAEAGMQAGSWYEVDGAPGIYASVMQPGHDRAVGIRRAGGQLARRGGKRGGCLPRRLRHGPVRHRL
jgi:hypothetical protein